MQRIDLRTVFTTASGVRVDLLKPRSAEIRREDVAQGLAKINRYSGSTPGTAFSVAQHCVVGAEAVLCATGNNQIAAYFLLHDGHEYLRGDSTTPKKNADIELAREHFGEKGAGVVREVQRLGDYRLDVAIHRAAGMQFPVPVAIAAVVKKYDLIMRETEWRDLVPFAAPWPADPAIIALEQRIECWPWEFAAEEFSRYCRRLLPHFA